MEYIKGKDLPPNPRGQANILSYICFWWVIRLYMHANTFISITIPIKYTVPFSLQLDISSFLQRSQTRIEHCRSLSTAQKSQIRKARQCPGQSMGKRIRTQRKNAQFATGIIQGFWLGNYVVGRDIGGTGIFLSV